jgi:predicted ATP-dependent serine protease
VSTVLVPRSAAEVDRDIAAIERGSKKLMRSKKRARAWFIKHGFITKDGKLTKRYGG